VGRGVRSQPWLALPVLDDRAEDRAVGAPQTSAGLVSLPEGGGFVWRVGEPGPGGPARRGRRAWNRSRSKSCLGRPGLMQYKLFGRMGLRVSG
jgi:hypothetical protein